MVTIILIFLYWLRNRIMLTLLLGLRLGLRYLRNITENSCYRFGYFAFLLGWVKFGSVCLLLHFLAPTHTPRKDSIPLLNRVNSNLLAATLYLAGILYYRQIGVVTVIIPSASSYLTANCLAQTWMCTWLNLYQSLQLQRKNHDASTLTLCLNHTVVFCLNPAFYSSKRLSFTQLSTSPSLRKFA